MPLSELIEAICAHYEFDRADASALTGMVDGVIADAPMSARDLIEPMARAFCFDAVESEGMVAFRPRDGSPCRSPLPAMNWSSARRMSPPSR